ncbi:hypothetical protein CEXT_789411 [Caerostris extrusa]|uniref:Uncharacterized protein n=1 Tax=Caerostris extrusa TaxID=172846 RepID=A0AAV4XN67_CAEEX|nr:hypothetical protein CEXT_789411 [Caerostris extrusa]
MPGNFNALANFSTKPTLGKAAIEVVYANESSLLCLGKTIANRVDVGVFVYSTIPGRKEFQIESIIKREAINPDIRKQKLGFYHEQFPLKEALHKIAPTISGMNFLSRNPAHLRSQYAWQL